MAIPSHRLTLPDKPPLVKTLPYLPSISPGHGASVPSHCSVQSLRSRYKITPSLIDASEPHDTIMGKRRSGWNALVSSSTTETLFFE